MDSKELTRIIYNALDDKKGENIKILDISKVSVIADYFVIVSGNNINQVQALADNVKEELYKLGFEPRNVEGYHAASWILLDYTDVIVHYFSRMTGYFTTLSAYGATAEKSRSANYEINVWNRIGSHSQR